MERAAKFKAILSIKVGLIGLALQAALASIVIPPSHAETFRLSEATVSDINAAMDAGALTSEELVQLYLNRINAYDVQGPSINALIMVNPNALEEARALDLERQTSGPRSPLHGIPIILKDNYDTSDMPTTAGSVALDGSIPPDDAFVVQQLRDAGAIILGKANMSEFAFSYGRLGYSSLGGLTLNPYDLTRNASGSSSGTAAAIAANFALLGTGSDTAGSIRGPANVTGLVGIKPTLGLVSRDGIVPLVLSFDVAGPIAPTVTDAAVLLGVMANADDADARTLERDDLPTDYMPFLQADALEGARIGLAVDFLGGNAEVDALTQSAIEQMEQLGATVVEVMLPEELHSPWGFMGPAADAEFQPQIEAYLATLSPEYPKTLEELIEVSESFAESETPVNPGRIEGYEASVADLGLADIEYLYTASNRWAGVRSQLETVISTNNIDAFIYPTMACPASPIYTVEDPSYECEVGDPYAAGYLANITGFPDITVPMGMTDQGLPVGLSFMSTAYSEPTLLGFAYAFEQAMQLQLFPQTTPPLPGEEFEY